MQAGALMQSLLIVTTFQRINQEDRAEEYIGGPEMHMVTGQLLQGGKEKVHLIYDENKNHSYIGHHHQP